MLVGIGAGKARRDLGAVDRRCHDAKCFCQYSQIEAREMKDLEDRFVRQKPFDVGRLPLPGGDLHHVRGAIARR
jgi:hypothetical protein